MDTQQACTLPALAIKFSYSHLCRAGKGPAGTASTLALHGGNGALGGPVDAGGGGVDLGAEVVVVVLLATEILVDVVDTGIDTSRR